MGTIITHRIDAMANESNESNPTSRKKQPQEQKRSNQLFQSAKSMNTVDAPHDDSLLSRIQL